MEAFEVHALASPDPQSVGALTDLVDRATSALGHAALSEHKRIELGRLVRAEATAGHTDGTVAVVARRVTDSALIGYAHVSHDHGARSSPYATELVVDPGVASGRDGTAPVADALLDAVVAEVAARGGGTLRLWVSKAGEPDDARASAHGFGAERDLIQMRCPLPLPPSSGTGGQPVPVGTRPFRPGLDEEAWLSTNNRAFATHPEQGHWELSTLIEREGEPWFDPEGLLLLEYDGRLAGSCWTKVHRETEPPMGEIYVIGVDPDFHGRGWGRALTKAGLDRLASQGLTVGMLYVDAGNRAAVSMYRSMGFADDHVDRAYVREVEPA
jgi:mycothiol synthase